jgi:hypothetical protein
MLPNTSLAREKTATESSLHQFVTSSESKVLAITTNCGENQRFSDFASRILANRSRDTLVLQQPDFDTAVFGATFSSFVFCGRLQFPVAERLN